MLVIVQLAIYVLGLDFYNYNLRELAKRVERIASGDALLSTHCVRSGAAR